jgi:hypothetical protein
MPKFKQGDRVLAFRDSEGKQVYILQDKIDSAAAQAAMSKLNQASQDNEGFPAVIQIGDHIIPPGGNAIMHSVVDLTAELGGGAEVSTKDT